MSYVRALWSTAALLAAGLAVEILTPGHKPATIQPAAAHLGAVTPGGAEPVGAWAADLLSRPLFNPGRRPDAGPAAAQASAQAAALPRLTGIAITPTGRYAIFAGQGEKGAATVASEGMNVGVWRVEAIRPGEVQVTGPGGRTTMRPSYAASPPATAPSVETPLSLSVLPQPPGIAPFPIIAGPPGNPPPLPGIRASR